MADGLRLDDPADGVPLKPKRRRLRRLFGVTNPSQPSGPRLLRTSEATTAYVVEGAVDLARAEDVL